MLIVYFNARCPVCAAGISRQKLGLVEAMRAGSIEFREIGLEPKALAAFGIGVEDVRRRLHALDGGGGLLVGADVAVAIWRATPGERWLAALLGNGLALPITRFFYDRFADWLYAWNRRRGHW